MVSMDCFPDRRRDIWRSRRVIDRDVLGERGDSPWATMRNRWYLFVDLFLSVWLAICAVFPGEFGAVWLVLGLVLSLLAHVLRKVEFFQAKSDRFCANTGLLAINRIKIFLILLLLVLYASAA